MNPRSTSINEVKARHPFPWTEQQIAHPGGVLFRMIDATGREVSLLELVSFASIATASLAAHEAKSAVNNSKEQDGTDR